MVRGLECRVTLGDGPDRASFGERLITGRRGDASVARTWHPLLEERRETTQTGTALTTLWIAPSGWRRLLNDLRESEDATSRKVDRAGVGQQGEKYLSAPTPRLTGHQCQCRAGLHARRSCLRPLRPQVRDLHAAVDRAFGVVRIEQLSAPESLDAETPRVDPVLPHQIVGD